MMEPVKDRDTGPQGEKVGVYICHCGGNISDHVDVETVRARIEKVPGVKVARTNTFMCSDPGQDLIAEDLRKGLVDRVVVASCAPSLHETTFRKAISRAGANPYLYEHANIREQVSWVHHGPAATEKAARLVAAAVGKARHLKPLTPLRVNAVRHATVIGGGVAGLRAARDLSARGFEVALVEKSPFLGGRVAALDRLAPTGEQAADVVSALVREVMEDPGIATYTCSRVTQFEGYVGNFSIRISTTPLGPEEGAHVLTEGCSGRTDRGVYVPFAGVCPGPLPREGGIQELKTGVIVLATGFVPYTPQRGEYGFADLPQVITLPRLIEEMAGKEANGKCLEIGGKPIRSMAMIHCVGSRQIPGIHEPDASGNLNEYCSRVCCSALLHASSRVRETFPGTRVYELYRDIRTYGRGQEDLYALASSRGVVFLRFEAEEGPVVEPSTGAEGYPLQVRLKDTLTFGEEIEIPVDLVVLAVGMEPNPIQDLVEMMKLPIGADGFLLEVHPKLRPVELPISGILLAGTCQAPLDIGESCAAAGAAAVKASGILGKGYVELEPFVAEVDLERCKGRGACVEACLREGALRLEEVEGEGTMVRKAKVFPALCLGCGACAAVCPEGAIQLKGWTLTQYEEMVDMLVKEDLAA